MTRGRPGLHPPTHSNKLPSRPPARLYMVCKCGGRKTDGTACTEQEEPGLSPHTVPTSSEQLTLPGPEARPRPRARAQQTQAAGPEQGERSPLHAQDSSCCSLSQKGTHFPSLHLPRSKHTVSSSAFPGGGHSLLLPGSTQPAHMHVSHGPCSAGQGRSQWAPGPAGSPT